MSTLSIRSRSGTDGKLHLEVPAEQADAEFDVELVVRRKSVEGDSWPPGYFELFGSISDETFVRPPQGTLSPAEKIE